MPMVICKGKLGSMANGKYSTWNRERIVKIVLQA